MFTINLTLFSLNTSRGIKMTEKLLKDVRDFSS